MKKCVKCDQMLNDEAVFCDKCGANQQNVKDNNRTESELLGLPRIIFLIILSLICAYQTVVGLFGVFSSSVRNDQLNGIGAIESLGGMLFFAVLTFMFGKLAATPSGKFMKSGTPKKTFILRCLFIGLLCMIPTFIKSMLSTM